jgi:hypothetical protein
MSVNSFRLSFRQLTAEKKVIVVVKAPCTFADLLKLANQKLRVKAKRLFLSTGEELNETNCGQINRDGLVIIVTKGEAYEIIRPKEAAEKR